MELIKFDRSPYLEEGKKAYGERAVMEQWAKKLACRNYDNVYLLGIGGTEFDFQPFAWFADRKSASDFYQINATSLKAEWPKHMTEKSLVITSSISGTTKETVESTRMLVDRGIDVLAFAPPQTALAEAASEYIPLNLGQNGGMEHVLLLITFLVYGYLHERGEFPDYPEYADQLSHLFEDLADVREQFDQTADEIASKEHRTPYTIITGSGSVLGEMMMFSMCFLEEMQWVRTRPCPADQFFHGCLELIQDDVTVFIFKTEDNTRFEADRVESFCRQIGCRHYVFDARDYEMPGFDEKFRELLSHWIICTLMDDRMSAHYEKYTGHNMNIRRYYRKFEY